MKLAKTQFLILLFAVLFTACKVDEKPAVQPNIVFIMSDDHAFQAISAYGHG